MSNWPPDKSRYYDKYGREGKCNIILDRGVGKILRNAIHNARKRILVSSPWIGRGYAKMLIEKALEGVEVYIITSDVENNVGKSILSIAGRHGEELRRAEENLKRAKERAEDEAAATRAEKRSARLAMVRNMTLAAIAAVLASIALPYANHLYAVIGLWAALIVNSLYAVIGLSPVLIIIFYHRGKQKIEQIDARSKENLKRIEEERKRTEEELKRIEEELRRAEENLKRIEERAEEELKTVDEKLVKAAKSVRALKNLRVLIYMGKDKERVVLVHAKLYIVDERAWIGSLNLTRAGVYEYYELLAEVDAEVAEEKFMELWSRLSRPKEGPP